MCMMSFKMFEGVSLDSIICSVLDGRESDLDRFIDKDDKELTDLSVVLLMNRILR